MFECCQFLGVVAINYLKAGQLDFDEINQGFNGTFGQTCHNPVTFWGGTTAKNRKHLIYIW